MTDMTVRTDGCLALDDIQVMDRHRRDVGDVAALAESIRINGLLHAIVVTPDHRLVAGQRRMEACRILEWATVPIRVAASITDAAALLRAERDENVCRKDMLPSELASLGAALYEIEKRYARERQRDAGTAFGRGIASGPRAGSYSGSYHESRDAVGEALGVSGRTYADLRYVHDLANDPARTEDERALARTALTEMDRTGSIKGPTRRLRVDLRSKADMKDIEKDTVTETCVGCGALLSGIACPSCDGQRTTLNAKQRRERIRELADSSHSSRQIAEMIGVGDAHVRNVARKYGFTIAADRLVGRTRRRNFDAGRAVGEALSSLEAAAYALTLIDGAEIDSTQAGTWVESLTNSVRAVNRQIKKLKEQAQ